MSTKTKTKQVSSQTNTNAPPDWTAPAIKDVAGMVMPALQQVRSQPAYNGDFVATPDRDMLSNVLGSYYGASAQSGVATDWYTKNAIDMATRSPTFGGGTTSSPFAFTQGPQIGGLDSILGGGAAGAASGGMTAPVRPGYVDPTMLSRPDFAAMAPEYASWSPTEFQADDGGARLDSALNAANQPFVRELMNKILPSIRSSAIESGAYSGDRAMSVLPTEAIADSAGRAAEVTSGLAYQGFQSEEARRLQAWQAMQQMLGSENANKNDFNLGVFGTRSGAENQAYGIAQNAQLDAANGKNAWGLDAYKTDQASANDRYGINTQAALTREQMLQDQNNNWVSNMLKSGQLQNDAFGQETARGLGVSGALNDNWSSASDAMMNGLMTRTAQSDILANMLQMQTGANQAGIDNNLAKFQYQQDQPWLGMDTATQLLTALSGNYGTQQSDGTTTTTQKTSGLGPIMQGLMGAAMAAGGLGAFGGVGGALGTVGAAKPLASIFGGGARAGMSA